MHLRYPHIIRPPQEDSVFARMGPHDRWLEGVLVERADPSQSFTFISPRHPVSKLRRIHTLAYMHVWPMGGGWGRGPPLGPVR
jgi:hypothetical protein